VLNDSFDARLTVDHSPHIKKFPHFSPMEKCGTGSIVSSGRAMVRSETAEPEGWLSHLSLLASHLLFYAYTDALPNFTTSR
jgi:hypothetical protein